MSSFRHQANLFRRYMWLYETIVTHKAISFDEISSLWEESAYNDEHAPLPHKTFENHRKAVELLFGVNILCDRITNSYYLEVEYPDVVSTTIRNLFDCAIMLNNFTSVPEMRRFVSLETVRGDNEHLAVTIKALNENRLLNLRYRHNYDKQREEQTTVKPIGIKLFRQRWYLVAEQPDGEPYSYPFDRIMSLSPGEVSSPSEFKFDELFSDCFGIIREKGLQPENITLKVEREQANYFINLPLHPSQRIERIEEDHIIFSLRVCPTYDFIMEILSHGQKVEVLAPRSLRERIATRIKEVYKQYDSR